MFKDLACRGVALSLRDCNVVVFALVSTLGSIFQVIYLRMLSAIFLTSK